MIKFNRFPPENLGSFLISWSIFASSLASLVKVNTLGQLAIAEMSSSGVLYVTSASSGSTIDSLTKNCSRI